MRIEKRYQSYKNNFLKKHKSKHGFRSFDSWKKRNKNQKKKSYSIFACDFETTAPEKLDNDLIEIENKTDILDFAGDNYSKVFLSGIWCLKDNTYKLFYENLADTFNYFCEKTFKNKNKKAIIFYHNLAFDGSYILKWLQQNNWKQTLKINEKTKQPIIARKEYALLMCGGKFFSLIFYWKGIKFYFFDSLKILPRKLEDLGEIIGYKKLKDLVNYQEFKLDPKHNYPKKWLDYLKRDCEILANVLENFFKKEPMNLKKMTIGSISYKHIDSLVKNNVQTLTIKDFYFFNQWYRGGLCFPSLKYQAKWVYAPGRIKMIDACSMYPSQMIKALPIGGWESTPNPKWKKYCSYYEIKIIKANIKNKYKDIACIPKPYKWDFDKKKIKIVFNGEIKKTPYEYVQVVENEVYHFIDKELNLIEQLYNIEYKILNTYYFELDNFLQEEVSKMFIEKQNASRHDNETAKMIAKLKLNNLYGKLGQKPIRALNFYGKKEDVPDNYKILGKKNCDEEAYNVVLNKSLDEKARPVHLAGYITMLARVNLLTKYKYIVDNGGKFLYCDTDSICYVDSKKEIKFDDIGDNLGQWEFEKNKKTKTKLIGDGFISLCPKQYRIVKCGETKPLKLACAGVNKEVMENVKNQDYNFNLGENNLYEIVKKKLVDSKYGKIIEEDSPFSFKKWKKYFKNIKIPQELKN